MRILLIALALLWSGAALAADYKESIDYDGERRNIFIHIPDNIADREKLPVVLVLHGGGGNAENIRSMTGMDEIADKNGFVAVYPEGNGSPIIDRIRTWNAGRCCGPAAAKKKDDVAFISKVIDLLAANYKIDTGRIYSTGHSNGGQMSYRLACELSERIAAIAPNAGQRVLDVCKPKRKVPVLHIHGTQDPCALFDSAGKEKCGGCFSDAMGGLFKPKNDKWACRPVRDIVLEHAEINGCRNISEITLHKGAVTCEQFTCGKDDAVGLCTIEGVGHVWAGKHDYGPSVCKKEPQRKICARYAEIVGPAYRDIDAGQLAWDFLKHYSLKGYIE